MRRLVAINEKGYRLGEDHPRAKLTNHEIDLLLELADDGMSERALAAKFEISRRAVRDYKTGRRRCQTPSGFRRAHKPTPIPRLHRLRPAGPSDFPEVADAQHPLVGA